MSQSNYKLGSGILMSRLPRIIGVTIGTSVGCAGHTSVSAPVAEVREVTSQDRTEMWLGVLRFYRHGRGVTEGDLVGITSRIVGATLTNDSVRQSAPARARITLTATRRPPRAPYDTSFINRVLRLGLARVCYARRLIQCPDTLSTTFLDLKDPRFISRDTAEVEVTELGVNPSECRVRETMTGFQDHTWRLVKRGTDWTVTGEGGQGNWMGTSSCGPHDTMP